MDAPTDILLAASDDDAILDLLRAAGCDHVAAQRLFAAVDSLDPFVDAPQLASVRAAVRRGFVALETEPAPDEPALSLSRALLSRIAVRQTPVGAALHALMADEPYLFTPALMRALWSARDRTRTGAELKLFLDDGSREFMFTRLVEVGAVQCMPSGAGGDDHRYLLTPAMTGSLRAIARRVLELEMRRYPWPETVPRPRQWASERGARIGVFRHAGGDARVVRATFRDLGLPNGSLSLPALVGVACEQQRTASPRYMSLALLHDPVAPLDAPRALGQLRSIIRNQHELMEYTRSDVIRLVLFVDTRTTPELQRELTSYCRGEQIEAAIASPAAA